MKTIYILLIIVGLASICYSQSGEEEINYYYKRGKMSFRSGKFITSIDAFNKVIEINSEFADGYYYRGLSYLFVDMKVYKDKFKGCSDDLTKYIKLTRSRQFKVYYYRGLAFYHQKKYQEALTDFNETHKLNPMFNEVYNIRGLTLFRLEQYKKAIIDFEKFLRYRPHAKPIVYYYLALCCEEISRPDLAIKRYRKYILLSKNRNPKITAEAKRRIRILSGEQSSSDAGAKKKITNGEIEEDEEDEMEDEEELE